MQVIFSKKQYWPVGHEWAWKTQVQFSFAEAHAKGLSSKIMFFDKAAILSILEQLQKYLMGPYVTAQTST